MFEVWRFKTYSISVTLANGEVKVTVDRYNGVSARAFEKTFGFASSNDLSDEKKVIDRAKRLARIGTGNEEYKTRLVKETDERTVKDIIDNEHEDDIEMIISRLKELDTFLKDEDGVIKSRRLKILSEYTIREYENSNGVSLRFRDVWSYLSSYAVGKRNGIMEEWSERKGWLDVITEKDILSFSEKVEITKDKVKSLLTAGHVKKGKYVVILDPEVTGVFTHEAVGHACEADSVLSNSSVFNKLGMRVGVDAVRIVDYPSYPNGFGNIIFDDEGVRARPVTLVDKGVLTGYMHSLTTSEIMGQSSTGNARMEDYDSPPIVRMRNTIMEPAEKGVVMKEDEIIQEVKDGLFIKGMKGGSVDTLTGTFMFGAKEAYYIKNGELKAHLRDVSLVGNITGVLNNITAMGDKILTSPGYCGKEGQHVRVSDGGPLIRVENMMIG